MLYITLYLSVYIVTNGLRRLEKCFNKVFIKIVFIFLLKYFYTLYLRIIKLRFIFYWKLLMFDEFTTCMPRYRMTFILKLQEYLPTILYNLFVFDSLN